MCLHAQAARGPRSLHDREENMLEPVGEKGTDHGKEGQGHSVEP